MQRPVYVPASKRVLEKQQQLEAEKLALKKHEEATQKETRIKESKDLLMSTVRNYSINI